MKKLNPYLIFPGTCREAMHFYAECLNGEIKLLQTFAESPIETAPEHRARIFNAIVEAEEVLFMASDNLPPHELNIGANVNMFVNFSDKAEQHAVFAKLAKDGSIIMPLEQHFGMLVDKYGIYWMIARE